MNTTYNTAFECASTQKLVQIHNRQSHEIKASSCSFYSALDLWTIWSGWMTVGFPVSLLRYGEALEHLRPNDNIFKSNVKCCIFLKPMKYVMDYFSIDLRSALARNYFFCFFGQRISRKNSRLPLIFFSRSAHSRLLPTYLDSIFNSRFLVLYIKKLFVIIKLVNPFRLI